MLFIGAVLGIVDDECFNCTSSKFQSWFNSSSQAGSTTAKISILDHGNGNWVPMLALVDGCTPAEELFLSSRLSLYVRFASQQPVPKHLFQVRHEKYDPDTLLHIRWNHEKYMVDFEGRVLGQVKLKELRAICKDLTDVPLGGLTLLFGDAQMKDDNAPLSCWGVKAGSKIVMNGIKPTAEQLNQLTTSGDPEEFALVLRILGSLEKSKTFVSEHLPKYEEEVESYLASNPSPSPSAPLAPGSKTILATMSPERKKVHDLHAKMSENLLQSLLALDGITFGPEFEVARAKRREAVKETQKLLDVIDAINVRVKESDKAAARL
ncbi:hypothetical protein BGZ65_003937 [Modicella reniformis]|uniref:BAG domain-containing protein n=1 Tax=Modicella reniformis TaxID=1440133 RepID=A0A9P6IKF9_9FUNG|nr:hypothetical protein BGZ65_003937 [Modicella reniformis]